MAEVSIVMGSDSDLPVMSEAARMLEHFQISYHMTILSAHRTPGLLEKHAAWAEDTGIKLIIAGAGGAAHLPGMLAAFTIVPVIGVPVKTAALSGVDSLYSIVQMPTGIPVATVAINAGANAGILAAHMIGSFVPEVAQAVRRYKKELQQMVEQKAEKLSRLGYQKYREQME